jgi:uncharacterized YigZ family protein
MHRFWELEMAENPAPVASGPLSYRVPAGRAVAELIVKNSTFVATVDRASDVAAAQAFIAELKARYADANHNASAFRITGGPQALIGSSDDGEPGGTAGRPMLAVLEGSGLCQVVAVVTRYFGGVKLGTGGLVRAYGGAVREALAALPTREYLLHHVVDLTSDYALYGKLKYLLPQQGVRILDETFGATVGLRIAVPHGVFPELYVLLRELSNGQIALEPNETRYLPTER